MALTTDFPGSSLPTGWTFNSPQGPGSVTVSDGRAHISFPNGAANLDSHTQSNGAENSIGIQHAIATADVDIAVQIDTDIGDSRGWSVNLLVNNGANGKVRWGVYKTANSSPSLLNTHNQPPAFYMASRSAANTNGPASYNVHTFTAPNDIMTGMPAWMRLTYNSGTGVWTGYYSTDGWNWFTPVAAQSANVTQPFTPAMFKVGCTAAVGTAAGTIRIGQVVDLLAVGTTDLREVLPTRTRRPVVTINGTDGSLPSSFTDDSEGGTSNISWTPSALRFSDNPGLNAYKGGWARIRYTGTRYEECGLLLRLQNPVGNNNCYGTVGLLADNSDKSIYSINASAASRSDSTDLVTATVPSGHGFTINQLVETSGFADSNFNGLFKICAVAATTVSWISLVSGDASTGAGVITIASRSPIDQYVRGGGYALEIQSGSIRRPIRVDDPAGTNVGSLITGSGSANTDLDEMPYFWMKNLTTTDLTSGAPIRMFRIERIGRRIRMKEWADAGTLAASIAAEPSTWNLIDGQDEVNDMPLGPSFVLSHNGTRTGAICQMDMLYMQYYELSADAGPQVRVKVSGNWEDAAGLRTKVAGNWEDAVGARRKSSGSWVD